MIFGFCNPAVTQPIRRNEPRCQEPTSHGLLRHFVTLSEQPFRQNHYWLTVVMMMCGPSKFVICLAAKLSQEVSQNKIHSHCKPDAFLHPVVQSVLLVFAPLPWYSAPERDPTRGLAIVLKGKKNNRNTIASSWVVAIHSPDQ